MSSKGIQRPLIIAALVVVYVLLSATVIYSIFASDSPAATGVGIVCIIGLVTISMGLIMLSTSATHVRASQTNEILDLANHTVTFMRSGLTQENAQEVCDLLLPAVSAVAVAITDQNVILGYSGADLEHHEPGSPIKTEVTKQTLQDGKTRVVETKSAEGFEGDEFKAKGTIIVPIVSNEQIIGTLKFYYTSPSMMDEEQTAIAEGFGKLLSGQIELSFLDEQTQLATRMELKALQAQINPHFLFNTINTIASYTRTDPAKARDMLREFALYYRRLIENSEDLITLQTEVDQVERYLMFQRARFGEDSVRISLEGEEPLRQLRIPAFAIQPLVENAVGHGRRPDGSTLNIIVRAYHVGMSVIIEVIDDGVGIPVDQLPTTIEGGSKTGMGIALKNVNARLKGYFGPLSGLSISSEEGVGTLVALTLHDALKNGEAERLYAYAFPDDDDEGDWD